MNSDVDLGGKGYKPIRIYIPDIIREGYVIFCSCHYRTTLKVWLIIVSSSRHSSYLAKWNVLFDPTQKFAFLIMIIPDIERLLIEILSLSLCALLVVLHGETADPTRHGED